MFSRRKYPAALAPARGTFIRNALQYYITANSPKKFLQTRSFWDLLLSGPPIRVLYYIMGVDDANEPYSLLPIQHNWLLRWISWHSGGSKQLPFIDLRIFKHP